MSDALLELTPIQRKGLDWFALAVSGRATREDLAAMEQWRDLSPDHAEALVTAVNLHRLLAKSKIAADTSFPVGFWERPTTRRLALGSMAAAVGTYAAVRPPLALWPSLAELSSDYRTGVGKREQISLGRGVSLDLNTATSVSLRSKPKPPGIELIAGEVAIEVDLPGAARFAAYSNGTRVLANKALFDLRKMDDGICVTCLDGAVTINARHHLVALARREQIMLSEDQVARPKTVDPSVTTAWRHGELVFYDAALGSIVAEINRYRVGKIIVVNSELAKRRYNGTFQIAQLDDVIAHLQKLTNGSTAELPGGIVILS